MSEWQPIETAPVGVHVLLGRYRERYIDADPPLTWVKEVGIAFETERKWFRTVVVKTYDGKRATHWKPLPAPPTEDKSRG